MGKLDGWVLNHVAKLFTYFSTVLYSIVAARRSKQDVTHEVGLSPPSINLTIMPLTCHARPAITRIATNLLYFPGTLGDFLSHNPVPAQRHNSHLGFVRRHYGREVLERDAHHVSTPNRVAKVAGFFYCAR